MLTSSHQSVQLNDTNMFSDFLHLQWNLVVDQILDFIRPVFEICQFSASTPTSRFPFPLDTLFLSGLLMKLAILREKIRFFLLAFGFEIIPLDLYHSHEFIGIGIQYLHIWNTINLWVLMICLEWIIPLARFLWQTGINSSHLLSFDHGRSYLKRSRVNYWLAFSWTQLHCATPVFVDESIFPVLTPNHTRDLDDNE